MSSKKTLDDRSKVDFYLRCKKKDRWKKVTQALKKLATSERMLKKMVGMSYSERCILLHKEMPDVCIKRTTLSRIYKEFKIKSKVIKKVKVVP